MLRLSPSVGEERQHGAFVPPRSDLRSTRNLPIEILSHVFEFGFEESDSLHGDAQEFKTNQCCEDAELGNVENVIDSDGTVNQENEAEQETGREGPTHEMREISDGTRIPLSFPIVVSHVCQHWRDAALSTASLWTNVIVSPVSRPPYPHVAAFLERSKCLPIDIRVRLKPQIRSRLQSIPSPSMTDLASLCSLLVAHVHRWRSVDVGAVSHQQMYALLDAISDTAVTTAPRLVSLVLCVDYPIEDDDKTFKLLIIARNFSLFSGSAPCLTHVHSERVFIDWNQGWMSHGSRLTTLELVGHYEEMSPSWDEFKTILRGAPALERLVLHQSGPPGDPPTLVMDPELGPVVAADPNPIPLVNLTHLSLLCQVRTCVYGILRTLYVPALKSLAIDFFWDDYTEFLWYITAPAITIPGTALSEIVEEEEEATQSLLHQLETLDIECLFCPSDVIEALYDELKNVRSLKISMDDFWYPESGCALVSPLQPPLRVIEFRDDDGALTGIEVMVNELRLPMRLPRLETLFISDVSDNLHVRCIREVVEWRDIAGTPIRALYAKGTCAMSGEDAAWFEENVETFVFSRQRKKW
ncbi:hypothetical protein OG21DRAFT_1507524 [Imleria badia]|nr:hypothetical protein OG21DRAFT_1507524 [Imleria badia]